MAEHYALECPIRGRLKASAKSKDGLSPSEEKLRIDAIRHLISVGYPKDRIKVEAVIKRFGHAGRNSFRADLCVVDQPAKLVNTHDVDDLLAHALVLGEVKRDNRGFDQAKSTQVDPMLDFASRDDCVALYWDDVEQRVFWKEWSNGVREHREGPVALLPRYGGKISVVPLTFADISPSDSVLDLFLRIEDVLHAGAVDPEQRYEIILQLLLAKLFDEHSHETSPDQPLGVQDFNALGTDPALALGQFNELLAKATDYYGRYLPKQVGAKLDVTPDVLIQILKLLAPVKIIASKHSVIQTFYMHFAKNLYRWELAQYFTPTTVTDFIVRMLNPQFGEHVKDPACGSADFLTAAFRLGRRFDAKYADCVWGADNSKSAVQVAILNMLLNGDGKSNIKEEDSLADVHKHVDEYDIVVCNPPFGLKIVEKRRSVLARFDLGHEWALKGDRWEREGKLRKSQETGLLFVEACVMQAKPGGRVGIVLPNGYLGNRSAKYLVFRDWLLRHCQIASVCSFPRFTFKTSGADVSASVVCLVKRAKPLTRVRDGETYVVSAEVISRVGWNVGNKRAEPIYRRDVADGAYLLDDGGDRVLDADFEEVLADVRASGAALNFPWLAGDGTRGDATDGWSVPIADILHEPSLCLDLKRYCRKVTELREEVRSQTHFRLGDVVDFVSDGISIDASSVYRYVEIQDIESGEFSPTELRGWQLPDRAKHSAECGDIFVGAIWSSVPKWCLIGGDCAGLVVTNGCHRLRVKAECQDYLIDLVAALCTETYRTQMRAVARGSDGLAEITEDDAANVILPRISEPKARAEIQRLLDGMLAGTLRVSSRVARMIADGEMSYPKPPNRPGHSALV